jgi:hypothetical protein
VRGAIQIRFGSSRAPRAIGEKRLGIGEGEGGRAMGIVLLLGHRDLKTTIPQTLLATAGRCGGWRTRL